MTTSMTTIMTANSQNAAYGLATLSFDEEAEATRIGDAIRRYLVTNKRKGIVVGVSGGIDSSVVAALAVKALGPDRV